MRRLSEIIQGLRSRPLRYWLGWSPPCSFELSHGTILKRVGGSASEWVRIAEVTSWKSLDRRTIAVRFPNQTIITWDRSGQLRSILQQTVADREERETEV